MSSIFNFLKENLAYIILGSIVFLGLLVLFSLFNGDKINIDNQVNKKQIGRVVTIESMDNQNIDNKKEKLEDELTDKSFDVAFCDKYKAEPNKIHNYCNKYMKDNDSCNIPKCCVWVSHKDGKEECVGGDHRGPTYHSKDESQLNFKEYHHRGKRFEVKNPFNDKISTTKK